MRRRRAHAVAAILVAGAIGGIAPSPARAAPKGTPCIVRSAGVDTSRGRGAESAYLGHVPGQTFFAADTVITSLTVWRAGAFAGFTDPMKLRLVAVDASGTPIPNQTELDGPEIIVTSADFQHPTEVRFDLDPPMLLPERGEYAFFVGPSCEGSFDLLVDPDNGYAGGSEWWTGTRLPTIPSCYLRAQPQGNPGTDLIFGIEFCGDTMTATRRASWGQVKTIYR
jgi:hypothetical protein